jgi:alcohol dehydrogenase
VPFADHSLVRLPPGVSPLDAVSVGDNLTDAWRTVVPHLARRPGVDVLILSSGSIGLYAADLARASGAREVRYVDADSNRCALAERFGARVTEPQRLDPQEQLYAITVNATDDVSGAALRTCLLATEPGGVCENTVLHFSDPAVPLLHMFLNCITLGGGLSHARANMPAVLSLIAGGRIRPSLVATDVLPFATAAEAIPGAGFKPVFVREPMFASGDFLEGAAG